MYIEHFLCLAPSILQVLFPLFLITILVCAVIFPTSQGRKLRPRKMKLFAQIQIRMLQ